MHNGYFRGCAKSSLSHLVNAKGVGYTILSPCKRINKHLTLCQKVLKHLKMYTCLHNDYQK